MPLPRPAPGTGRWWAIGAAGCLAMLAVIIWLAMRTTVGAVHPEVTGFKIHGDSSIQVSYRVNRPEGTALRCVITALDSRYGRVGALTDDVPAGEGLAGRTVQVRTTARATTGVIDSCVRVRPSN